MTKQTKKSKFGAIPLGLRILFIISSISIVLNTINIVTMAPYEFDILGTGFPANFPALWHVYNLSVSSLFLYIVWTRKRMAWKIYIAIIIIHMTLILANQILYYPTTASVSIVANYGFYSGFIIAALITFYVYKQKAYFNK